MTFGSIMLAAATFAVGIALGAWYFSFRNREVVETRGLVPYRTRQVISAINIPLVIVRKDRRAAYSNQAATTLGVARPDGALLGDIADLAERAWAQQTAVEEEIELRRGVLVPDASAFVRVVPIDLDLALVIANDNTEQRAAEITRREFAVNVSHELKTPVGALSLLAESIESGADDPALVRKFAGKMRKEARRLTKLIQEIIEISRLQGPAAVADLAPVNLRDICFEALDEVRVTAEARNIKLASDIQDVPDIMGDHDLLLMAFRNLLHNAINYSDRGKHVTLSLRQDEGVLVVSVVDQGIGIDAEDAQRIFERFYRADPARARDTGGTGLGLSIVKHVALQHAGNVQVWSRPNLGSTFGLYLPIAPDLMQQSTREQDAVIVHAISEHPTEES